MKKLLENRRAAQQAAVQMQAIYPWRPAPGR
jgi:hypothetical protein